MRFGRRKIFDKEFAPQERRKSRMFIFLFVWGVIFAWLAQNFVISLEVVKGDSMYPTLKGGEFYLVNKFVYFSERPERGDLVVIKNIWQKKDQLIKRVIGIPGDVIEIRRGKVYLNGTHLLEPYVRGTTYPAIKPFRVEEGMYFVLGDNREVSYDSRACGFIEKNEIRGKLSTDKLFTLK